MRNADLPANTKTIRVVVRFLSALRDRARTPECVLVLPGGSTLREVSEHLLEAYGVEVPSAQRM